MKRNLKIIKSYIPLRNNYVVDTMALVLWLEKRKLSKAAKQIFEYVDANEVNLIIPSMVLAEIGYLSEKKRIEVSFKEIKKIKAKLNNIVIEPLTDEIIYNAFEIKDIPELHDRLISVTAKYLGYKVITNDPAIIASKYVSAIW